MKKIVFFVCFIFCLICQIFAGNKITSEVDVPYNDFLELKKECCLYHLYDMECSNDSVIPYFLYEYSPHLYNWSGIMIAIPIEETPRNKLKYRESSLAGPLRDTFFDILFDKNVLLANYDLYVYYVSVDQLTNVNDNGDSLILYTDTGEEYYDWTIKDDANASLFHYEEGKWKFIATVATENYKIKADFFARDLIKIRFDCK